jgi:hypothetical protein
MTDTPQCRALGRKGDSGQKHRDAQRPPKNSTVGASSWFFPLVYTPSTRNHGHQNVGCADAQKLAKDNSRVIETQGLIKIAGQQVMFGARNMVHEFISAVGQGVSLLRVTSQ